MAVTFAQVLLPGRAVTLIIRCELVVGRLTASSFPEYIAHERPTDIYFVLKPMQRAYSICVVVVRHMAVQGRLTPPTISCVSIYRLISMYNGSGSNTSTHTRFAKPLEIRRTSQYPEMYSIIHYLSQQLCVTSTGTLMAAKAGTKRPMHGACKPKKATQTIRGEMQASGST